jgi:acyl-CoA thioesterase-1
MYAEPLFFVQEAAGAPAARLLFAPDHEITLADATRGLLFEARRDFELDATSGVITLSAGSRVPFTAIDELYPKVSEPSSDGVCKRGEAGTRLLADDHVFHERQVGATYRHSGTWHGYRPVGAPNQLPRTRGRLQAAAPLTLGITGDSISEGYNASGYMKVPPFQPPYGTLLAHELERTTESRVRLINRAVAGWSSEHGVWDVEALGAEQPDLAIIAYGMNDAGYCDVANYSRNTVAMMDTIRRASPQTEFILVASMRPHPDWDYPRAGAFERYRDALAALCGSDVALADMTSLWSDLLQRKSYWDLTGNGFNHPNDFGHRLYAAVIVGLLVDPGGEEVVGGQPH